VQWTMTGRHAAPDLSTILSNVEANLERMANPEFKEWLCALADTSDDRYFRLLIEAVCMAEPISLPGPFTPPLGSGWSWGTVRRERLERLVPLLGDMRRVAGLTRNEVRRIYKQAGVPARYRYNWQTCINVARFAVDVVDDSAFGSLKHFFDRYVRLEQGGEQVPLCEAIRARCDGVSGASLAQFIQKAGLDRSINHWAIVSLARIGLISVDLWKPYDRRAEKDAVVMLSDIAEASGKPFQYVSVAFARSSGFSAFWDPLSRDSAICFYDLQRCEICRHNTYCERNGISDDPAGAVTGWLDCYTDYKDDLAKAVTTLGKLPSVAIEAVLAVMDSDDAVLRQIEPGVASADIANIAASLTCLPIEALWEKRRERTSEFHDGTGYVSEAEKLTAENRARRNFPCILAQQLGILKPFQLFAWEADVLLDFYRQLGATEVPVLAVDWGEMGRIRQDRKAAGRV
jgi:hypothetical protein